MDRRLPAAILAGLALAAAGCGGDHRAVSAVRHDPVLFVHGFGGSGQAWNGARADFAAAGWPRARLVAWTYDSTRPNAETARAVAVEVGEVLRRTGARRLDIVTHSMGALSTRWYLKRLGGARRVDAWVSLAGPNHGTTALEWCAYPSCRDMSPGSPFLTTLNAGDETPGRVRYATWASPCDTVVPEASVALRGARNTHTSCVRHGAIVDDPKVLAQVRRFLG